MLRVAFLCSAYDGKSVLSKCLDGKSVLKCLQQLKRKYIFQSTWPPGPKQLFLLLLLLFTLISLYCFDQGSITILSSFQTWTRHRPARLLHRIPSYCTPRLWNYIKMAHKTLHTSSSCSTVNHSSENCQALVGVGDHPTCSHCSLLLSVAWEKEIE